MSKVFFDYVHRCWCAHFMFDATNSTLLSLSDILIRKNISCIQWLHDCWIPKYHTNIGNFQAIIKDDDKYTQFAARLMEDKFKNLINILPETYDIKKLPDQILQLITDNHMDISSFVNDTESEQLFIVFFTLKLSKEPSFILPKETSMRGIQQFAKILYSIIRVVRYGDLSNAEYGRDAETHARRIMDKLKIMLVNTTRS
jgi:hypothetical protein